MEFRLALLLAMVSSYTSVIANFATLAIVSRLLSPSEVGLFVLGNAVVLVCQALREFAPCHYLIQRPVLEESDVRSGITVMVLVNLGIAISLVLASPWVSHAYQAPELTLFLQIAAVATLLDMFSHPIIALLSREMAFGKVAIFNIFNSLFYLLSSITFLYMGLGFVGLAWAWLATSIANAVLAFFLKPGAHFFRPSKAQWRDVFVYGMRNGSVNSLLQLFEQVPYLLLGRFNPAPVVASYNRAFLVSRLPDRVVVNGALQVVLPGVSKTLRDGLPVSRPYLHGIEILSGIQWPILIFIGVFAAPVLRILLGEQWVASAPLLELLVAASALSFVFPINIKVMAALGAMNEMFRCAVRVLPISIVIAAGTALLGGKALALSLILIVPLQAFATFHVVRRQMGWEWKELLFALGRSAIVAAFTAAGVIAAVAMYGTHHPQPISHLLVAAASGFLAWLVGIHLTQHAILSETKRTTRELNDWARRVFLPAE